MTGDKPLFDSPHFTCPPKHTPNRTASHRSSTPGRGPPSPRACALSRSGTALQRPGLCAAAGRGLKDPHPISSLPAPGASVSVRVLQCCYRSVSGPRLHREEASNLGGNVKNRRLDMRGSGAREGQGHARARGTRGSGAREVLGTV
uniref:Uncharacterized protein n=1 Tax=Rousettus aegyptiacus TaxID=9407 RepID=A0A7J8C2I2_ROUAE|nr:hypothetical protein HJG63_009392 [Rousettus aegyptiacus]